MEYGTYHNVRYSLQHLLRYLKMQIFKTWLYHYKFQLPRQFGSFIVIAVLNLKVFTFYVFSLFYIFCKKYFKCNRLLNIYHQISKDEMSRDVTYAEGMQNAYKTLIKYPKERRPLLVHGNWNVRILIGFIWLWILSTMANLHICKRLRKYQLCSRDCHME
jgi:hypothetical protein